MKSKLLILFALILLLITSCNPFKNDDEIKLIPIKIGEKYGFIDRKGKIVINPQFDHAAAFIEDLALVVITKKDAENENSSDKGYFGFIDREGKYVIEPKYKFATVFRDGIAWTIMENGAPVAINNKGESLFTLKNASKVHVFSEGLAGFSEIDSDGNEKWGFVDKEGKVVINPQFSEVIPFQENLAGVCNKENKWGFIDKEGKILINYQFDIVANFTKNKAIVEFNKKYGVIDNDGKYVINPTFDLMRQDGENFIVKDNDKFGYVDKDGKYLINPQFDEFWRFNNSDLAPVKSSDEKWGYIDKDGKYVINPQFDFAYVFNGDLAQIQMDEQYGFINKEGKIEINPQFKDIGYINYNPQSTCAGYCYGALFNGNTGVQYYHEQVDEIHKLTSDYFEVSIITNLLKKELADGKVGGLNFDSKISDIASKFGKKEGDFGKYVNEHKLLSGKRIGKKITYDFYVIGSFWGASAWFYDSYFKNDAQPEYFAYIFTLDASIKNKTDLVKDAIVKSFDGAEVKSNNEGYTYITTKTAKLVLWITKENTIVLTINKI